MLLPGIKGLKYFFLRFTNVKPCDLQDSTNVKPFLVKKFLDQEKILACGKLPWLWKVFLVKKLFDQEKIFACGKRHWFWKTSLIMKSMFLEKKNYWKLLWLWRNTCLWKASLIMEISLVLEHFFNPGKVFACVKLLCLWKKLLLKFSGNKVHIQDFCKHLTWRTMQQ